MVTSTALNLCFSFSGDCCFNQERASLPVLGKAAKAIPDRDSFLFAGTIDSRCLVDDEYRVSAHKTATLETRQGITFPKEVPPAVGAGAFTD